MNLSESKNNIAKKTFREKGTCSRTFAYLLNKEFGNSLVDEEVATDPLAGGIMRKGHQCGMLWGSALAIGAESYRRTGDVNKASALAILSTQKMMESFMENTNTVNCKEITGCSMDSFFGLTKFMVKVTLQGMDNSTCFKLAEDWYPEAIKSSNAGLSQYKNDLPDQALNCASEVVKKIGGTKKEMAMVAGFAGGMGLSGNGCGALSAAIWKRSLDWVKEHPGKSAFGNKPAKNILKKFKKITNSELICQNICNRKFQTIKDHSFFIKNGGCKSLLDSIAF